jgi:NADP-dependent alcohol dehydrogenase
MFSNFNFYNPTKIIFGKETIAQLPKNIPLNAKILLCYGGGSIFKNTVHEQVKSALSAYEIIEFGGIEPNPTFETLMKAVEIGRAESVEFLLAVGGGSVIDGVKFISAAIPFNDGNEWDNIVLGKARFKEAIPFGTVLTLPATGSEMNSGSVISRASTHEKQAFSSILLYPKFSILDPTTTYSLPSKQVANGIADAYVHVMEQYLTFPVNAEIQDRFAESILITLINIAPKAMSEPNDYETRANFMWAATVALNGWINLGVPTDWASHQIGHELTVFHGIDHARTLAVVLPHLLEIKKEQKRDKLIQYAKRVWGLTGSDDQLVAGAIQKTIEFFESIGIPTKASYYEIGQETIQKIKQRFTERNVKYGEHKDITADVVADILELSIA